MSSQVFLLDFKNVCRLVYVHRVFGDVQSSLRKLTAEPLLQSSSAGSPMRRNTAVPFVCVLAFAVGVGAQGQEFARVLRNGEQATLSAFGPRPVDLAAEKLAEEFGIALNVEDPVYLYRDDIEQIGTTRSGTPLFIPKSSLLEMRLDLREDGSLVDGRQVVIDLKETASRLSPFEYRVDDFGHAFSLIPFRTRDEQGRFVQLTPMLDRRVTIPRGTRKIFEHVNLLTESLQQQTGVRVSCCQATVAGIPWGSTVVSFGAKDEPARSVLLQLLRLEPGRDGLVQSDHRLKGDPGEHWRWTMRCEPRDAWCFISVTAIPEK
jgi:hypothetical protein